MPYLSYPGVYLQEVAGGVRPIEAVSTSTPAFVGLAEMGPPEPRRVTSWSEFQRVYGGFNNDCWLAPSVLQFFNNGGRQCYVIRVVRADSKIASVTIANKDGNKSITISAKSAGEWGNSLLVSLEDAASGSDTEFRLSVRRQSAPFTSATDPDKESIPLEVFDNLSVDEKLANYAKTVVTQKSQLINVDFMDATKPTIGFFQVGDETTDGRKVLEVAKGSDGDPKPEPLVATFTDAFNLLDPIADFSLLAVPGEGNPDLFSQGVAYCEKRPLKDVFFIGEFPEDARIDDLASSNNTFVKNASSYGALYYPWINVPDPTGKSRDPIPIPPAGFIAGIFARIDSTRGVWKAPAGVEATVAGAVGLKVEMNDTDHGNLNIRNINVIRQFPSNGIVCFGARTVSNDPQWKYIPVRRLAMMIRVSVYYGIQWAVFEPNDEGLWSQLRVSVSSFMMSLFRQGAFQGQSANKAFFVKCDSETTTQDDIDNGVVNVVVGFAPVKPAEFVVVKISQKAGQT